MSTNNNPTNNKTLIIASSAVLIVLIISITVFAISSSNQNMDKDKMNSSSKSSQTTMKKEGDYMMKDSNNMKMDGMMSMSDSVKDDKSFLENMIPHHQEAIDTSNIIIAKTNDAELKAFAQEVIKAQSGEIKSMKEWYKMWFNKDYTLSTSTNMMGDLSKLSGKELDQSYTKGMIMHHQGAIDMAVKIKKITTRNELKQLADNIISSQATEVVTLKNWLMAKYNDHNMMGM